MTVDEPRRLRVVAVSGSLHEPSRTTALVRAILHEIESRREVEIELVEVSRLVTSLAVLDRDSLSEDAERAVRAVEQADLLIAASPVYRASFTGLFKHFFDFVDQYALSGLPVLLAATGGSDRHSLVLEHQLRPLFGFFQALTLPTAVYASQAEIEDGVVTAEAVNRRITLAVSGALSLADRVRATHAPPEESYVI